MATAILRPNAVVGTPVNFVTSPSGGSLSAVVSDQSNSTAVRTNGTASGEVLYALDDMVANAAAVISAMRIYVTIAHSPFFQQWGTRVISLQNEISGVTGFFGALMTVGPGITNTRQELLLYNSANYEGSSSQALPKNLTVAQMTAMQLRVVAGAASNNVEPWFYEIRVEIDYNTPPVLTTPLPNATVTATSRPTFSMVNADPDGDAGQAYEARLFSLVQVNAENFANVPAAFDATTPLWSSGVQPKNIPYNTKLEVVPTVDLPGGMQYRMYMRIQDTAGVWSPWSGTTSFAFATVEVNAMAIPAIVSVTPDNDDVAADLVLQAQDNLISADNSTFDASFGNWTSSTGATRVTGVIGADGSSKPVMQLTRATTGTVTATTSGALIRLTPGLRYSVFCAVKAVATARDFSVRANFFDSANVSLSNALSPTFTDKTTGYTYAALSFIAPANTSYCELSVSVFSLAANEVHYADQFGVTPGDFNLIANGSFQRDVNADNFPDSFDTPVFSGGSTSSVTSSTEHVFIGERSIKLTNDATGGAYISQTLGFGRSKTHVLEFYVWVAQTTIFNLLIGPSANSFGATETSSDWSFVGTGLTTAQVSVTGLNKWVKVSVRGVTAAGTTEGTARITLTTINATAWIGAVHLNATDIANSSLHAFRADRWTRGGMLSVQRMELQRSVDGGSWVTVRTLATDIRTTALSATVQRVAVSDYFAQPDADIRYRLRTLGTDTNGSTINSSWSAIPNAIRLAAITKKYLKSTTDAAFNVIIKRWQGRQRTKTVNRNTNILVPIASQKPIVVNGAARYEEIPFSFYCATVEEAQQITALFDRNETMILQDDQGQKVLTVVGNYTVDGWDRTNNIWDLADIVIAGNFVEVRGSV